jgi:hypothetical protein
MSETTTTPAVADATLPVTETTATPAAATQRQDPAATPAAEGSDTAEPARDPSTGRFAKRTEQIQAQIGQLTATKHQVAREVESLRRQAEQLRQQLDAPSNIDPSDYAAQTSHDMRRAVKAERYEQTVDAVKSAQGQAAEIRQATFVAKVEAARERIPDIESALQTFATLPVSDIAADHIADSDKSVEIAYYLAKNPLEAQRIARLPLAYQGAEIARIESRVSAPTRNRLSQAPAPVQTVSGGSGSQAVDLATASFADYEKARFAQMKAAQG